MDNSNGEENKELHTTYTVCVLHTQIRWAGSLIQVKKTKY